MLLWLQFITPFLQQLEVEVLSALCLWAWDSRKGNSPCPAVAAVQAELPGLPAAARASDHPDTAPVCQDRLGGMARVCKF